MGRWRQAVGGVVVTLAVAACTAHSETPEATRTPAFPPTSSSPGVGAPPAVDCEHVIDRLEAPPPDLEVLLDAVALPTRTVLQANESGEPGLLFAKHGLVVRAGVEVEVAVQAPSGRRQLLTWGSPGPEGAAVRVPPCTGASWIVFAGGYLVDAPACVRLVVRSVGREARTQVPVGAPC